MEPEEKLPRKAGRPAKAIQDDQGPVNKADPVPTVKSESTVKPETLSEMAARTKKALDAGPQMTIAIPLGQGEKKGAKDSVTINGYRREFLKGEQVTLPVDMAKLVLDHYNIGPGSGIADEFRVGGDSKGKNLGDTSS